jgi:type VI secretion system secreted protein Hcp
MAADMFMKIDTVDGEAQDTKHKNEIDVLSWAWGMSNAGSTQSGSGGNPEKSTLGICLSQNGWIKASPKLFLACCSWQHFKDATLVVRKAGEKPVEYLKDMVLVSSIQPTGSGRGDDRVTENVTLNFPKVSLDYVPQDDKGAPGNSDNDDLGYRCERSPIVVLETSRVDSKIGTLVLLRVLLYVGTASFKSLSFPLNDRPHLQNHHPQRAKCVQLELYTTL